MLLICNLYKNGKIYEVLKEYIVDIYIKIVNGVSNCINLVVLLLSKINSKILTTIENEKEYESLSPKDDLDKDNSYIKALKESIEDFKRRNIAISGIYGSGKSSIIESFKKHHKEYKYLEISLATFISSGVGSLEDELERNILNQIFYKVRYNKMPYSRFRKIKNIKPVQVVKVIIIYALLITSSALIIKPTLIESLKLNISNLKELLKSIPIVGYNTNFSITLIVFVFISTIIYISISLTKFILSKFTINKIQTKDGRVEVGTRVADETFNKYLDEIMYFFESAKYDVVFFEDLDRFDNLEIFTKLRELNTLINNSESINRKITFVYAIKDEIFFIDKDFKKDEYMYIDKKDSNKNRTKFFDFIIPVIPIVNGENSYEVLVGKITKFNKLYGVDDKEEIDNKVISDELLSDISLFIDDMRLLTNIYNEFLIYYKRLVIEGKNKTLRADNLFAIIVYKNLYPVDFTKLQNQGGMVYDVFYRKNNIVDKMAEELYSNIKCCELNIKQLEREIVENEEELYLIYNTKWNSQGMVYIKTDDAEYTINHLNDIEIVKKIKRSKVISYRRDVYGYNYSNISFEELMTINGSKGNYYERLVAIKSKGNTIDQKIRYNQNKIQAIENQIKESKDSSTKTLMNNESFLKNLNSDIKKEALIIRLLKYGYIDEMYPYYILYFYEGRLTKKDFEFVQSVVYNNPLNYNFKLTNISDILVKLRIEDFKSVSILNNNLIKFLSDNLTIDINELRLKKVIKLLAELKKDYVSFIINFLNINKYETIDNFIKLLCQDVDGFWNVIYNDSYILLEQKDYILELILRFCNLDSILLQNNEGNIKKYIESKGNFIKSIASKIDESRLNDILIKLNIKLNNIDGEIINEIKNESNEKYVRILDIIYANNLYEINFNMLNIIILCKNKSLESTDKVNLNYSSILKSGFVSLIDYVNDNINLYIKNVFLEEDITENTDTIIDIVNNENIENELVINIVNNKYFKVDKINKINNINIWSLLLDKLKVNYNWENLLIYYKKKNNIDKYLGEFINNSQVYKYLVEDDLYKKDISSEEIEEIDLFVESFIKSEFILDEIIGIVSWKLGGAFSEFSFENLSNERVNILIDKELVKLNENIYKSIKSSHYGMHISLLEKNIENFEVNNIQSFDSKDLELIMKSEKVSEENKYNVIQTFSNDIVMNETLAESIYDGIKKLLYQEKLEYKLVEDIIKCNIEKEKKINLIIYQGRFFEKQDIVKLLSYVDKEYNELLDLNYKKMYLTHTDSNISLLEFLKSKKYISTFIPDKDKIIVNRKRS